MFVKLYSCFCPRIGIDEKGACLIQPPSSLKIVQYKQNNDLMLTFLTYIGKKNTTNRKRLKFVNYACRCSGSLVGRASCWY